MILEEGAIPEGMRSLTYTLDVNLPEGTPIVLETFDGEWRLVAAITASPPRVSARTGELLRTTLIWDVTGTHYRVRAGD